MTFKPPKPAKDPVPRPGVEAGDELYLHHGGQPCTGRVVCHGKHGVTADIDGGRHPVKWDQVLGHKSRVAIHGAVIDKGEDGMLLQDQHGRRRYVATPEEAKEDPLMVKGFDPRRAVLIKAGPIANRPGLTQRDITDNRGVTAKRWVTANPKQPHPRQPAKVKPKGGERKPAESGSEAGYGTHNLEPGDTVSFKAGDFKGSGKIVGKPGTGGAHVKDSSGREHRVKWSEITGHDKGDGKKPPVKNVVHGAQGPVHPDEFNAAEFAASHDDANVTPEAILQHFPPDTAEKITAVQERLKSIEQTIDKHKKGDDYQAERQAVHRKIYSKILSPERIAAAAPAKGQQPTFTILGGRGGSGKSWFKGQVYDEDKAIVLDADEIKGELPEYEGWNAAQVHEESSDIMNTILETSRKMGLNVVLDGTLASKGSALKKVEAFKGAGYRMEAHYMHLPRQEAAKRAVQRFLGKTNRYVPVDVVLANRQNEANFDAIRQQADKWSFRDNNVPHGEEPKLISESGPKKMLTKSDHVPIILLWK